ncbi:MAG TPA: hypothetical protein VK007_08545 [Acidimicrobiales bacterium]|nr:hypothetical protein [Acidimicrobiales bacterium]
MSARRTVAAALAAAVLLTGACSDDAAGDGDAAPTTAPDLDGADGGAGDGPSTTLPPGAEEVVLRGDGLGVASFGDDPDEAVAALTEALGPPTDDAGWTSAFGEHGTCPGEEIRAVAWDHLVVLFTDGETEHGDGPHLFAWRLDGAPPALGTETGFGWGATAADAEDLHPGRVELVPAEEPFPAFLVVDTDDGPITAFLDEHDVVTHVEAGAPCGE